MPATETVVLRGGITVPVSAVRVLLDLEDRGIRFEAADNELVVSPRSRLTLEDDQAIRAHRDDLAIARPALRHLLGQDHRMTGPLNSFEFATAEPERGRRCPPGRNGRTDPPAPRGTPCLAHPVVTAAIRRAARR